MMPLGDRGGWQLGQGGRPPLNKDEATFEGGGSGIEDLLKVDEEVAWARWRHQGTAHQNHNMRQSSSCLPLLPRLWPMGRGGRGGAMLPGRDGEYS